MHRHLLHDRDFHDGSEEPPGVSYGGGSHEEVVVTCFRNEIAALLVFDFSSLAVCEIGESLKFNETSFCSNVSCLVFFFSLLLTWCLGVVPSFYAKQKPSLVCTGWILFGFGCSCCFRVQ